MSYDPEGEGGEGKGEETQEGSCPTQGTDYPRMEEVPAFGA